MAGISSKLAVVDANAIPKTIIFVQRKNVACKIFSYLKSAVASVPDRVNMYHASLTEENKTEVVVNHR